MERQIEVQIATTYSMDTPYEQIAMECVAAMEGIAVVTALPFEDQGRWALNCMKKAETLYKWWQRKEPVLLIDADVRPDINLESELVTLENTFAQGADFMCEVRHKQPRFQYIQAGILGFNKTAVGMQILERWSEGCEAALAYHLAHNEHMDADIAKCPDQAIMYDIAMDLEGKGMGWAVLPDGYNRRGRTERGPWRHEPASRQLKVERDV